LDCLGARCLGRMHSNPLSALAVSLELTKSSQDSETVEQ
jgi:hypothetical protein